MPPQGGTPEVLFQVSRDRLDRGQIPASLHPLPGGRTILYQTISEVALGQLDLWAHDRERDESTLLLENAGAPTYLPFGVLVYQTSEGRIDGVRFDPEAVAVVGDPIPLVDGIRWTTDLPLGYAVSRSGVLVYEEEWTDETEIVWVDRSGRETLVAEGLPTSPLDVELSPDGARLALAAGTLASSHIWVYDLDQRTQTRVTSAEGANDRPVWTPDGSLSFVSDRSGIRSIYRRPVDGSAPAVEVVRTDRLVQQITWRSDGAYLFREGYSDGVTDRDIFYRLPGDSTIHEFLVTEADEFAPDLSPEGRWVTYASDESGAPRVYVRAFPGPGGRTAISTGPALEPAWSPDGRTIYYRSAADSLVAASVDLSGDVPRVTARANLFSTAGYLRDTVDRAYSVHPDGERFVFIRQPPTESLVVVTDWFREVRERLGIRE